VIKSVEMNDNGEYICRAQNSEGFGRDSLPIYIETKGFFFLLINLNIFFL
jgi:hypothetical protein